MDCYALAEGGAKGQVERKTQWEASIRLPLMLSIANQIFELRCYVEWSEASMFFMRSFTVFRMT
jgi:hypothetical protein